LQDTHRLPQSFCCAAKRPPPPAATNDHCRHAINHLEALDEFWMKFRRFIFVFGQTHFRREQRRNAQTVPIKFKVAGKILIWVSNVKDYESSNE
jgi:hypothetical protein